MHIVSDIGATKTRIAGSIDLEAFGQPLIFETQQDYRAALARFVEAAKQISGGHTIEGAAIGVPGVISRDKRSLTHAANLPLWNGAAIAEDLQSALNASVSIENDAALAGLGEAIAGAGQGCAIMAYMTVSTGVNGVRIVDGDIDRATYGFEIGEQLLGVQATAPNLEQLVSGRTISERFGVNPWELREDHPIWEELAQIIAIALHNTNAYWSPERIVIGGSMMNEIGISMHRIRMHLEALPRKYPVVPKIVHASLGDVGGLWGALARLKRDLFAK